MARPASALIASALIRRVHAEGGSAMVLARGNAEAGAILVLGVERGANPRFYERGIGPDGRVQMMESGPSALENDADSSSYWQRRRERDPDLWVIELDIADAKRFAADALLFD